MSVFGSIVSAIFGSKHAAGVTPAATSSSSAPSSTGTTAPSPAFINGVQLRPLRRPPSRRPQSRFRKPTLKRSCRSSPLRFAKTWIGESQSLT